MLCCEYAQSELLIFFNIFFKNKSLSQKNLKNICSILNL